MYNIGLHVFKPQHLRCHGNIFHDMIATKTILPHESLYRLNKSYPLYILS